MGRVYDLNRDGCVYALAIEEEAAFEATEPRPVHLRRIDRSRLHDHDRYE